ncbi:MAG: putative F420-0--gamma-glutamyl ligase [Parcubacteria group bacterium Greene0714_21]|nr:MAG: putative F420-0--gamma-glutamyl ligase [Parcubacteria group bacterium Greene0416_39]TSC97536.1 MAG: putative F420-0--gamma-glutamyl ligase [Parcubacteria group bacterium Greene1014_47]TSD04412.1 MAG: putative F420-0--gamma-glutamyl ligase [Parcubacteria group bacterium Greene0714_21]
MRVTPVKTHKIIPGKDRDIFAVLDKYLPLLKERTVVAVTSKIVAICEGRVVPIPKNEKEKEKLKDALIIKEAELYLPRSSSRYNVLLTVKGSSIIFSSGVDESNARGYFVLWPKDPQKSANAIREHLAQKYKKKHLGVIITDTTSVPLRWGQRGVFVLAHSGFSALNSYIGKPDIFGRKLKMTSAAIADALGTAAVLVMGEGAEQTPLAVIEGIAFVKFQERNPTKRELKKLRMPLADDLYAPLLKAVKWRKGGS